MPVVHKVLSPSGAMSNAFEAYHDRIADFREKVKYVDGAVGMAVAIGDRVCSVDVFDKPATCQKVWDRMLSGVVFDALEAGQTEKAASTSDVEQLLAAAGDLPWEQAEAVGEGEEYRAESNRGDHASALAVDQSGIHGSVMTAV